MQEFIMDYLDEHGFLSEPIPEMYLPCIYELFHNDKSQEVDNDIVLVHFGIYHDIHQSFRMMVQYYERAAAHGNTRAMNLLWIHYENKYFEKAIKYAMGAIECNDYRRYHQVVYRCVKNNAIDCLITIFNKTLYNNTIANAIDTIVGALDNFPLTYDTVNILININPSKYFNVLPLSY